MLRSKIVDVGKSAAYDIASFENVRSSSEKMLTVDVLDEECVVCHPYAHCEHNNNILPTPNDESTELPLRILLQGG